MGRLSETLQEQGWINVYGFNEIEGAVQREIGDGIRLTWDFNCGVLAVFDETGRPWVRAADYVSDDEMTDLRQSFLLRRGAYVPFSNDGGTQIRTWFPKKRRV